MYLSRLRLNPRSRKAMTEVGRPYELHRSLMTAFPDRAEGGQGKVMFRLDTDRETGDMSVLVQSEKEPDWCKLNGMRGFIADYESKEFAPNFAQGQVFRFRLRVNPTKRVKETGKRQGIIGEDAQIEWLRRRGSQGGFEVIDVMISNEGFAKDKMTDTEGERHNMTMLSVRFDGLLRVTDPNVFRRVIEQGIGSAKGFGFGLLSVAPGSR